jgi:hypothetical protein
MSAMPLPQWPDANLDTVQRLRVIAAGLPHVAIDEIVIDAPVERVWDFVGDLERGTPAYERGVRSVKITQRDGDRVALAVRNALGIAMSFRAELRFGWCVMQSRSIHVGMAAAPEGDGAQTRFAHFEGSALLGRVGLPYFRWNIRGDLRRIEAQVLGRAG